MFDAQFARDAAPALVVSCQWLANLLGFRLRRAQIGALLSGYRDMAHTRMMSDSIARQDLPFGEA